jgi:hypothetical protein
MEIFEHSVKEEFCSCNFCDRGSVNTSGYGLVYPYEKVYSFKRDGTGLLAFICPDCLKELQSKVNELSALSSPTIQVLKELLGQGKKLASVKYYADETKCGLKQAKDFVDKLVDENPDWYKPDNWY